MNNRNKMKPIIQKIGLLVVMLLAALPSSAYDFEVDGFYYEVNLQEMSATLVAGENKQEGEIVIPPTTTYKGREFRITAIKGAFTNNMKLTSIQIPSSITILGDKTFSGCSALASVTGMENVETIGASCFAGCTALKSVKLPTSLTEIGKYAFYKSGIEAIHIPENVISIGRNSFGDCPNLSSVNLEGHISILEASLFRNCKSLSDLSIPNSVIEIKDSTFYGCSSLPAVTIPKSVSRINRGSFEDCSHLETLIIEDSSQRLYCTTQYNGSFCGCPITNLYIGRDLDSDPIFGTKIKSAEISNRVTFIPSGLFEGCKYLTEIAIPNSVNIIDETAFRNAGLKRLIIEESFNNITIYNYRSFEGCNFEYVYIGRPIVAEYSWNQLPFQSKKIIIGDCVDRLSRNISILGAEEIQFGLRVDSIPDLSGQSALTKIQLKSIIPPKANTFSNTQYMDIVVEVPPMSKLAYSESPVWKDFWSLNENKDLLSIFRVDGIEYRIIEENSVTVTGTEGGCSGDITIPENVTYDNTTYPVKAIERNAFNNCYDLLSITLPESITRMDDNAFSGCHSLKSFKCPNSTMIIGNSAFKSCMALKEFTFDSEKSQLQSIGDNAFQNCKSLSSFNIPGSCEYIGNDAFNNCTNLSSLIIGAANAALVLGSSSNLHLGTEIYPYPNPSDVDERRTGFRNGYYDGLFYGLPIKHLTINRDISINSYYERQQGAKSGNYNRVYNDIVYNPPFFGLPKLTTLEIGEHVSSICKNQIEAVVNGKNNTFGYNNFGGCDNLEVVIAKTPKAPIGGGFSQSVYNNATLFLPNGGEASYKADAYWQHFSNITEATLIPITSISLTKDGVAVDKELVMDVNEKAKLTAVINPYEASIITLKWESSDNSIVDVTKDGEISSANKNGTVTISAKACDGSGISASIKVVVKKGAGLSDVSIDKSSVFDVYSLQGILFRNNCSEQDIQSLSPGIYLLRQGEKAEKFLVH